MKKLNIFLGHLAVFIVGSIGIALYVFTRLGLARDAGIGGIIVMPVVALIYTVAFGMLCSISLSVWLLIAVIRRRRKRRS